VLHVVTDTDPPSGLDAVRFVREGGVEPPHPFGHTDLNRARLPIPPLARGSERPYGRWEA
jgi:hypothetical protein